MNWLSRVFFILFCPNDDKYRIYVLYIHKKYIVNSELNLGSYFYNEDQITAILVGLKKATYGRLRSVKRENAPKEFEMSEKLTSDVKRKSPGIRLRPQKRKQRRTLPEEELFSSFVAYWHILSCLNPNASKHGLHSGKNHF